MLRRSTAGNRSLAFQLLCAGAGAVSVLAVTACWSDATCSDNLTCDGAGAGAGGEDGAAGKGGGGAGGVSGAGGKGGAGGVSGAGGVGGAGGNGGTDGGRPDGPSEGGADTSGGCNGAAAPGDNACVIDEAYGVFVSAQTGDDGSGTGTRQKPYKTIATGIAKAHAASKRVYVCADANYAEAISVGAAADGSVMYGGFGCGGGTWTYGSGVAAKIAPSVAQLSAAIASAPFTVKNLTAGLTMVDFEVDAPDATAAGGSSIAMWSSHAANVTLTRVTLKAGAGFAGNSGTAPSNYPTVEQSDSTVAGHSASGQTGGPTQLCSQVCANSQSSTGGKGGDGMQRVRRLD